MAQTMWVPGGDTIEPSTGRAYPGNSARQFVEPAWNAARVAMRPLDYAHLGQLFGHYRVVTKSGATNSIGAGTSGILASFCWSDIAGVSVPRYAVLLRLGVIAEITAAITTAAPIDLQAFVFRGATGKASGSGSSTATLTGNNNKIRGTMSTSIMAAGVNSEIRTLGTTTALTAAAGKANDSNPFGVAMFGTQIAPNVGATANVTAPIAAVVFGMQDLYKLESQYSHPIVLANNEGIEIQTITAGPASGGVQYAFLWEWAEVAVF